MTINKFRKLRNVEKKANIVEVLLSQPHGLKLGSEYIEKMLISLDVSVQYEIKIVTTAKELNSFAMLKKYDNYGYYNNEPVLIGRLAQTGKVLLGELEFGFDQYDDDDMEEEKFDADFDVTKPVVFTVNEIYWYTPLVNYDTGSEGHNKNLLVVYIPEKKPFKYENGILELIEKLGIGNKKSN